MADVGMGPGLLYLGGDHVGPQAWKNESAARAMANERDMMRAYVETVLSKVHLDFSEGCADDPPSNDDRVSADRSAEFAARCEECAPDANSLKYVVGWEVPPPGGGRVGNSRDGRLASPPAVVTSRVRAKHVSFRTAGLQAALNRVIAHVVLPGMEFSSFHVDRLRPADGDRLLCALDGHPGLSFVAHSTDCPRGEAPAERFQRSVAMLKVGPALTLA